MQRRRPLSEPAAIDAVDRLLDVARPHQRQVAFENLDRLVAPVPQDRPVDLVGFGIDRGPRRTRCPAAGFFALFDDRHDIVVPALAGDGVRRRRVAMRPDPLPGVRAQFHQHARHFRVAIEHGDVQRQPGESGRLDVHQFGPRLGQPANRGDVAGVDGRTERRGVHPFDMLLEFRPARKPIRSREHPLSIGQRELRRIGLAFESLDLRDGGDVAGTVRLEEFLGLLAKLVETRPGGKRARGRRREWDMTSSFPRLLAAWLGVRVANRKKVRRRSNEQRTSQVGSALSADTAAPCTLGHTVPSEAIRWKMKRMRWLGR